MSVESRRTFSERDEYQRQPIAEKIIRLLASDVKVSPMVIDGSWGSGKTEFCHKLIHLAETQDSPIFKSIYVDAFRADHADQPLMTLLAAVIQSLPEPKRQPLVNKALPVLRFGLKTLGKAAVSWVLKQDAVDLGEEAEEIIKSDAEAVIDKNVESLLADHIKADASMLALRDALTAVAAQHPMTLFVDELDRCRPDFAVAMLESIKHVFDVPHVKFVLITNTQQLKAAINHCYGSEVDAQRYLDKFLGFSFRLPAQFVPYQQYQSQSISETHFSDLINTSPLLQNSTLKDPGSLRLITELIKTNQLSMREVETLVNYFEIYQELTPPKGGLNSEVIYGYALLRLFGIYCVCFSPSLAADILNQQEDISVIAKLLGKDRLPEHSDGYMGPSDFIMLVFALARGKAGEAFYARKTEDQVKIFEQNIAGYFNGGYSFYRNESEERVSIVAQSIQVMMLS